MELTSANVGDIFRRCLFDDNEVMTPRVEVVGIMNNFGFHPGRIESLEPDIKSMLDQLPTEFKISGGGGWSFLQMCIRADGHQWTGMHQIQEQLMVLGMAAGWVLPLLPRRLWGMLPGGMPYVQIADIRTEPTITHVVEESEPS